MKNKIEFKIDHKINQFEIKMEIELFLYKKSKLTVCIRDEK